MSTSAIPAPEGSGAHVLVVHGTWAHGIWRSLLWRFLPELADNKYWLEVAAPELRESLEGVGEVESFVWSGKNSHQARIRAGDCLRARIEQILGATDRPLYILSHSHGGNVVLYALAADSLRKRVAGIVCLATPFLHVRPQTLDTTAFRALPLVSGFLVLTVLFTLLLLGWFQLDPDGVVSPVFVVLVGFVVSVFIASFVVKWMAGDDYWANRKASIEAYCDRAQPSSPVGMRVWLARKAGDEATAALVGGRLVELLLTALWRASSAILGELPDRIFIGLGKLGTKGRVVFGVLAIGVVSLLLSVSGEEDPPYAGYLLMALIGAVLAVVVVQVVLGGLIGLLNLLRFGWSDITTTPFVRVTSEPTPEGSWPLSLYPMVDGAGPAHSEVYSDPKVIDDICTWIRDEV